MLNLYLNTRYKRANVSLWLWVRIPLEEMKNFTFSFSCTGKQAKLDVEAAHQYAIPLEFGRKWETELS